MDSEVFSYQTVGGRGESEFKDRGSKFLGYCVEVESREDIKEELKSLKAIHPKANHHCYAWRLGTKGIEFRANDNGEPAGSAGRPIMRQIDSAGLTNILVVVVRYFGGTLLGIPGLVNAYKTTATDCIHNTSIIEREISTSMEITFGYPQMNDVMTLIKKWNVRILKKDMELFCVFTLKVPLKAKAPFVKQMELLQGIETIEKD